MSRDANIDYDRENDILYAYSGDRVKDSLQIEDFVIDFSMSGKVNGVEMLGASKAVSRLSGVKVDREMLSKVKSASIEISQGRELVYIFVILKIPSKPAPIELRIPVVAPLPAMRVGS